MHVVPDNAQHIGTRDTQQDAFGFSDLGRTALVETLGALSVVADGMGGLEEGQEISRLACRTMIEAYTGTRGAAVPDALRHALHAANDAVLERARQLGLLGQTGTTLAAAVAHRDGLHWISVGDSRIYLFRDGRLTQLTVDHGYARHLDQQVAAGEISDRAAASHPERHALTSFLGLPTLTEVDHTVRPFPLRAGDRILLCTDGLYGALSESDIADVLARHPRSAARALIDAAVARSGGSRDNVTATLMDVAPDTPSPGTLPAAGTSHRPTASRPKTRHAIGIALLLIVLVGVGVASRSDSGFGAGARRVATGIEQWIRQWLPLPGSREGSAEPAPEPEPSRPAGTITGPGDRATAPAAAGAPEPPDSSAPGDDVAPPSPVSPGVVEPVPPPDATPPAGPAPGPIEKDTDHDDRSP